MRPPQPAGGHLLRRLRGRAPWRAALPAVRLSKPTTPPVLRDVRRRDVRPQPTPCALPRGSHHSSWPWPSPRSGGASRPFSSAAPLRWSAKHRGICRRLGSGRGRPPQVLPARLGPSRPLGYRARVRRSRLPRSPRGVDRPWARRRRGRATGVRVPAGSMVAAGRRLYRGPAPPPCESRRRNGRPLLPAHPPSTGRAPGAVRVGHPRPFVLAPPVQPAHTPHDPDARRRAGGCQPAGCGHRRDE